MEDFGGANGGFDGGMYEGNNMSGSGSSLKGYFNLGIDISSFSILALCVIAVLLIITLDCNPYDPEISEEENISNGRQTKIRAFVMTCVCVGLVFVLQMLKKRLQRGFGFFGTLGSFPRMKRKIESEDISAWRQWLSTWIGGTVVIVGICLFLLNAFSLQPLSACINEENNERQWKIVSTLMKLKNGIMALIFLILVLPIVIAMLQIRKYREDLPEMQEKAAQAAEMKAEQKSFENTTSIFDKDGETSLIVSLRELAADVGLGEKENVSYNRFSTLIRKNMPFQTKAVIDQAQNASIS